MAKAATQHNMGGPDLSRRGHSSSTCGYHCHLHPFWRAFYVGVSKPGKNDEAGLTAEICCTVLDASGPHSHEAPEACSAGCP
jgi:hypothetical protein